MIKIDRLRNISRTICTIRGIRISVTVILLPDDKNPIYVARRRINTTMNDIFMYLDYPAYISIRLPIYQENGRRYDKSSTIIITMGTQEAFIEALKEMIDVFNRNDIFYIKDGVLSLYPTPESAIISKRLGDHYIELRPTIVEDLNNNASYEGTELRFDRNSCIVQLTYRELKALYRVIDHIDIPTISQLLINYVGNKFEFLTPEERKNLDVTIESLDSIENAERATERPSVDAEAKKQSALAQRQQFLKQEEEKYKEELKRKEAEERERRKNQKRNGNKST